MTSTRHVMPVDAVFEQELDAAVTAFTCGDPRAGNKHIEQALVLADETRCTNSLARVLAARFDPGLNVDDIWLGHFDRAWAQLEPQRSTLAVELLRSQVYATFLSDPELACQLASRAKQLATELDDDQAMAAALDAQRVIATRAESTAPLLEAGIGLLAIGRRGDRLTAAKGYEALIFAAILDGNIGLVERHLDAYLACAGATSLPRHQLYVSEIQTLLALSRGDLRNAQQRVSRSMSQASAIGDSLGIQMALAQQALIATEQNQVMTAITISDEQLAQNPLLRWWKVGTLFGASRHGNEIEVADHLDCLMPDPSTVEDWRMLWLGELVVLADAAVLVGDVERAQTLHRALVPRTHRFATLATAVSLGSIWRPVAELSALLGNTEQAVREFERADAANRQIGALPWLGRTRLGHAKLLHRLGDHQEAMAKAEAVLQTARRLDLQRLEDEAQHMVNQIAVTRPAPAVAADLTDRESELLAAVADGCSNRELADRFFVSVKTVERHLSNVYNKLGVGTRAEAVAMAFPQEAKQTAPHIRAVS